MTNALVTFGIGPSAAHLEITRPRFEKYAQMHGYEFSDETNSILHKTVRPASWHKIPIVIDKFEQGYDTVVWLDADVFIRDFRWNIAYELAETSWHGLVLHQIPNSAPVPNCGVWVLRRPMIPVLEDLWQRLRFLNHPWWEQAALIEYMGGDPMNTEKFKSWNVSKDIEFHTTWLDYRWNQHPMDLRRFDTNAYFWHATMFRDRLQTLKEWANDETAS